MWTNKQFWLDSTWRAFRTFSQTLAALLAASFTGLLQATGQTANDGGIPHTPWLGFLYASGVAALISLLQSVDRERAVTWYAGVGQQPQPEPQPVYVEPTPTTPLPPAHYYGDYPADEYSEVAADADAVDEVRPFAGLHGHGESLR